MKLKPEKVTPAGPALLTREQAAEYMQCSTRSISDWQAKRLIPVVKLAAKCVRFRKSDLDAVIDRLTVRAVGMV